MKIENFRFVNYYQIKNFIYTYNKRIKQTEKHLYSNEEYKLEEKNVQET